MFDIFKKVVTFIFSLVIDKIKLYEVEIDTVFPFWTITIDNPYGDGPTFNIDSRVYRSWSNWLIVIPGIGRRGLIDALYVFTAKG